MLSPFPSLDESGLEVIDLISYAPFNERAVRARDHACQNQLIQRMGRAVQENPLTILQELVSVAVELCGADSAGISIEREEATESNYYEWVATAGEYTAFLNVVLPRQPSACGVCLERGRPQLFRVGQAFFDLMGVTAPLVTDGILIPWQVETLRGTIFIMAHSRAEAFDAEDCKLMQALAELAAMGVKLQREQVRQLWIDDESAGAA